MRTQEETQPAACPELPRCKRSEISTQDQFSQCANPRNEVHNESTSSLIKSGDSCTRPCRTSGTFGVESFRHPLQRTDPGQSWQAKCSKFIINLPVTLSDKLFGPRSTTCEGLKRTICDEDLGVNGSQPVVQNTFETGSRDQGSKKSTNSLTDRSCCKNLGTDGVFLQKANRVDACYSTTSKSIQCGRSFRKFEKGGRTCEKVSFKCAGCCEDSFTRLETRVNHPRGSEPRKCEARDETGSWLNFEVEKRRKTSPRLSNWPAIIYGKFFAPRNEEVLRRCVADDQGSDGPEIGSEVGAPSTGKKGRLLLKKYTISQTPDAMEETLCFDVLAGKDLPETRAKFRGQVCLEKSSDNRKKLETIRERNECLKTSRSDAKSKRCAVSKSSSRKRQKLEKKTSTKHIFLSSLIAKLLNKRRDGEETCEGKKRRRNTASGENRCSERRCASNRKSSTVSREYAATTGIHRRRKKSAKSPGYGGKHREQNEAVSRYLDCRTIRFPDTPGNGQTRRIISSDCSGGRKEVSEEGSARTNLSEGLCKTVTEMTTRDRFRGKSIDNKECHGREKFCKRIILNDIEHDDLQLANCRGPDDPEMMSKRRKTTEDSPNLKSFSKNDVMLTRVERKSRKLCHREQLRRGKVSKRLLVAKTNEISDRTTAEGKFVLGDENIREKMFYDRETSTDDLPGSAYCQSSKRTSLGANVKNGPNCVANAIKKSERRDPDVGSHAQSGSPEEDPLLGKMGNGSMQKQPEMAVRIGVGCEECVGSLCKDDAWWVSPRGISEGEDIPVAERDVGKVFSSLWQESRGERGNTVCESKTRPYKALIKSETKDALGTLKEDEFFQSQGTAVQSYSEVNDRLSEKFFGPKEECDFADDEPTDEFKGRNDDRELVKLYPQKSEQPGEIRPRTNTSWIKSPGNDLAARKPESRNIINSYYSPKKSVLASRREACGNEDAKMKKGKVIAQRDGSASEKSIAKTRRPFQRIENVRQMGRTVNVVIKDRISKERDAVEKENHVVNKRTDHTRDKSILDGVAKDYLVRNIAVIDKSNSAFRTNDRASSIQKPKEINPVNPASRIPKIYSKPLAKKKTPDRSSSANLKENLRNSCWLKKGNSGTAGNRITDAKKGGKIAGSESSNGVTGSIDTLHDRKVSKGHREPEAPAYIIDKDTTKARTLRTEMSSLEEQNFSNDAVGGEKRRESSECSKSSSRQRNCKERYVDGSCSSSASSKETNESSKQSNENQSKSKTASKKTEKDAGKSTRRKLLSQIDFKIDASTSMQGGVTMNADLFAWALMDEKNNIKSYRDLQSAGEENSNSNRISASRDEGLRKSATATTQSKSKVLKSSESGNIEAKKALGETADEKTKHPGSPPCKSNYATDRTKNLGNMQIQRLHCSAKRKDAEDGSEKAITDIGDSLLPKDSEVKRKKSTMDSESNGRELRRLQRKEFANFSNEGETDIEQHDNVPEKLSAFRTSGRTISNSTDRNLCLTDHLKRFLDQGQEFFTSKRRKNSNQTTLCSDGKQEPTPCGSCGSNGSEASCETTEFCKSVDYEKLKKSLKICDDDGASGNSVSSLEKAYSTLKTILNKQRIFKKVS